MAERKDVYMAFSLAFKQAHSSVWRKYSSDGGAPMMDVLDALVEASYQNLIDAVTSRLVLSGKINHNIELTPKVKIRNREMATAGILLAMGVDLQTLDVKHEYVVSIVKRERTTRQT